MPKAKHMQSLNEDKNSIKERHVMDRRKFLGALGIGSITALTPIASSSANANNGQACGTKATATIYFLNPDWGYTQQTSKSDRKQCIGKACHFNHSNKFYASAVDAENARLHICCIAPVQSRTIALSEDDLKNILDGNTFFDIRNWKTENKLKDTIAKSTCSTPDSISKSAIATFLATEAKVSGEVAQFSQENTAASNTTSGTLPITGKISTKDMSLIGLLLAGAGMIFTLKSRQEISDENNI